ncbi:MAG: serine/threonine protein kinase [Gemmatimonadetes bacterium]|nr:serine/threonine protein kinase [Gemmatimonadota bacterium]
MSQRRCPKCRSVYTGEARFCSKDGTQLVEIAPAPAAAAAGSTQIRQAVKPPPSGTDPAKTLRNQTLDSRYQVVRKLGEGGMSFVYEAKDIATGESVAVKIMTPKLAQDKTAAERLRREAGLAMRLDHLNICRILRLGETPEGLIYLVMPLLKGELLSDKEVREGPVPLEVGVPIMKQVCEALSFAHEHGIVHRDLKPENIFLVPDAAGQVKAVVTDFGLAKEKRAGPGMAKLTATGIILGTPEFMSPEQIRGRQLDGRSDVYALGLVAYEMFTGRLPFEGKSAQDMMIARLRGQPLPLRKARADLEFSPQFEKALMKAIEADPGDRYQTARELGEALEAASAGGGLMSKLKGKLF